MNLGALLSGLGSGIAPVLPDMMGRQQQAPQAQQMPPMMQQPKESGFNNFLGFLADTLLINSGRAPMFGPMQQTKKRNREMGTALANYLGNSDAALQQLFMTDPETGLELYKLKNPAAKEEPSAIREFRTYRGMPDSDQAAYREYLKLTHPGTMSPLTLGPNDTIEMPGGSEMPTFSTPEEAEASGLPSGTKFRAPNGNVYQIRGGATASPSPTFP